VVGILLVGRWANEVASGLTEELEELLAARHGSVRWRLRVKSHRFHPLPREVSDAIEAAREQMLEERWDLAVLVTDLPLAHGGRPVVTEVISPTHRVAVISLPALGARRVRQRLIEAVAAVVGELVGEQSIERDAARRGRRLTRMRRRTRLRLAEIAGESRHPAASRPIYALRVALDHTRLLGSMVLVNRPWRVVAGLYRALIAALAFVVLTVVTESVWKLATQLGIVRLAVLNALSAGAMIIAIVVVHRLWERPLSAAARRQVSLFNWATLITVSLGVAALYVALLAMTIVGTALLVPGSAMHDALGRPGHIGDYLSLAWLLASLATVGAVLGASLETDAAIRHAVYLTRELRAN
jgi:hypothetical protein